MAMFVHLAADRDIAAIRRSGLRFSKRSVGVYAMPVLPNFFVSHQWLRELKLNGRRTLLAVYFRIPDDEPVFVGRYNKEQTPMTAAQAAARIARASDSLGMQVIVPRAIGRREIHRVRSLPQKIGWRYFPDAHGRFEEVPLLPGTYGVARRGRGYATKWARETIKRASAIIAKEPDNIDALLDRGRAYETLGEIEMAYADFTAALAIDPEDELATEDLRRLRKLRKRKGVFD